MKIYVIVYEQGHYEDTQTGLLEAYTDKERAENFQTSKQKEINEYDQKISDFYAQEFKLWGLTNPVPQPPSFGNKPWNDPDYKKALEEYNNKKDIFIKENNPQNKPENLEISKMTGYRLSVEEIELY